MLDIELDSVGNSVVASFANFVIKGQHNAYDNVLIQREIRGSIDRLELHILDRAIAQTPGATGNDLRLLLHCGDGIEARLQGKHLQLTHPDSKHLLEISMPNKSCKLHYGEVAGANIRGVTGLGFMQQASIYTLECEVPFETDLLWTLNVKMLQEAR